MTPVCVLYIIHEIMLFTSQYNYILLIKLKEIVNFFYSRKLSLNFKRKSIL